MNNKLFIILGLLTIQSLTYCSSLKTETPKEIAQKAKAERELKKAKDKAKRDFNRASKSEAALREYKKAQALARQAARQIKY